LDMFNPLSQRPYCAGSMSKKAHLKLSGNRGFHLVGSWGADTKEIPLWTLLEGQSVRKE
jgi:hypothetical protein